MTKQHLRRHDTMVHHITPNAYGMAVAHHFRHISLQPSLVSSDTFDELIIGQ